jgi:hypothetical protein
MIASKRAVLFILAAASGGCAASAAEGAHVRVSTTSAAYQSYAPAQLAVTGRVKKSRGKESPRVNACKSGNSRTCNELGDGLAIKHAHAEAQQWYATSCERVRSSMVPNASRLMQLSQDLAQVSSAAKRDGEDSSGTHKKLAELKSDLSEIKARIQGCLDVGHALKAEHEPRQALKYYDAVCEFSTLVEAVGEAAPGLQHVTETGCAEGEQARTELSGEPHFSPGLFADLAQPQEHAAAKPSASKSAEGMVFSEGDL